MNKKEAIGLLTYKINMSNTDVYIGDLDKTNIEAIKIVLQEIERLGNIIDAYENYLKEHDYKFLYGVFLELKEFVNGQN